MSLRSTVWIRLYLHFLKLFNNHIPNYYNIIVHIGLNNKKKGKVPLPVLYRSIKALESCLRHGYYKKRSVIPKL